MEVKTAAFGKILRKRRRESGLTQRDLAERVGVDFSYISKLENDRLPAPAVRTIRRLTEVLGASDDEFLAAANKSPEQLYERSLKKSSHSRAKTLPHLEVLAFGMEVVSDNDSTDGYYIQLLHGIQTEANRLVNAKVEIRSCLQPRFDAETLEAISQRDGLILTGVLPKHMEAVEQALATEVPLVLAGRYIGGRTLDCVLTDPYPACQGLVDYLYDLGFRRFGWIGHQEYPPHYEYRLDMVRGRLTSKGLQILPKDCRLLPETNIDAILQAMDLWISEGDLPEVLICSNGSITPHVQRAMASAGLKCPDDLSIACFDNHGFVPFCHPEPTRMATFPAEIGRRAYRRMLEILQDESEKNAPMTIMVPTRFIEGASVKPPRR